jgi:putative nucleotidyltransferase with HDIG domain
MFAAFPKAIDANVFWRHSIGCALLSQRLAKIVRSASAEKVYLAGLLHDLGILVNATIFPEEYAQVLKTATLESLPLDEVEREVLGFTHADSGKALAEVWKFSQDIRAVMEYHHDVTAAPVSQDLIAIVHLSDLLCRHRWLGYGYDEARQIDFTCSPAWLILVRNCRQMGRPNITRFSQELDKYFDEIVPLVDSILDPIARPQPVISSN